MSNRERLLREASGVTEAVAAEMLDFLAFVCRREEERKRKAFDEWAANCPEDDEARPEGEAEACREAWEEYQRTGESLSLEDLRARHGI